MQKKKKFTSCWFTAGNPPFKGKEQLVLYLKILLFSLSTYTAQDYNIHSVCTTEKDNFFYFFLF